MKPGSGIGRPFAHRNYRLFFGGQLLSLVGTWMQHVAQMWLVYRLTGSALMLGTITFAANVPVLLLAPLGGSVADRYPRRAVLVVTQTASMCLALALAILVFTSLVRIEHVVAMAGLLGVVNAVDIPTR